MAERRSRVYRQCQMCTAIRPASEFTRADERAVYGATQLTRCPACQHVGAFIDFRRVEPPAEAEGAGGSQRATGGPQS